MNYYLKRLWCRAENLGYSCFFTSIVGFLFRVLINVFMPNNGLVKTGIPYDELVRPLAVYLTLLIIDKLLRKMDIVDDSSIIRTYLPHILTFICWSGIWESLEYLTILPQIIKGIHPTILGTIKDILMDLLILLFYKSKLSKLQG